MKLFWLPLSLAVSLSIPSLAWAGSEDLQSLTDKKLSPNDVQTIYNDRDQDEVITRFDQCQNSYSQYAVNEIGCELDSDMDGVFDQNDQCSNTPEGRAVNFLGCENDSDLDGVVDSMDECPMTPVGTKVDEKGCRLVNDQDQDGVIDSLDMCPNTPLGAVVNENGCVPQTNLLLNIIFNTDSAMVRSDQAPRIDVGIATLKALQPGEVVLITGHTDSIGDANYNLSLSWKRAQQVKQYLLEQSDIASENVYLLGLGETSPIADNNTTTGRAQNRRIQLQVLPAEELPQGVRLATPD